MQGAGPSARYAHTLSLVANRFLVAMGGNDGKSTLGDAWALDTSEKPYQWRKITDASDMPCPRYCKQRNTQGTSTWQPLISKGRRLPPAHPWRLAVSQEMGHTLMLRVQCTEQLRAWCLV